ncbi:MAG: hypothetical protein ACJ789_21415 [Thermomicrobiales bacterium]
MDDTTNGLQSEATQPPAKASEAGGEQPAGGDAPKSGKEDFKSALANLASALNKFGAEAEVKAREEWKQAKPEIQRALDEMKRAVGVGAQKATMTIDSLGKKMDKNKTNEPGSTTWTESTPSTDDSTTPPQT